MTESDICICHYPKWVYDKYDKEYYAMPLSILERSGVKKQKGDIEFSLELDEKIVKFLAVPFDENFGKRGIPVPDVEMVYHDVAVGHDIISKQFMQLTWEKLNDKHYKKYDVKSHFVLAGCETSDTSKVFDELEGKEILMCENKEVYKALHPIDEFLGQHILELESIKDKIYI